MVSAPVPVACAVFPAMVVPVTSAKPGTGKNAEIALLEKPPEFIRPAPSINVWGLPVAVCLLPVMELLVITVWPWLTMVDSA